MGLLNISVSTAYYISLSILFFITSSITELDRLYFKAYGDIPKNKWAGIMLLSKWIIGITLLILNWKFAMIIFVSKYILSLIGSLKTIGDFLISPFRK